MTEPINEQVTLPKLEHVHRAASRLKGVIHRTPLMHNLLLSEQTNAQVWLKREDLQVVRSYKIRGAYNKMSSLPQGEVQQGIVCASAGNHAQGVALACQKLGIPGTIFMPQPTPQQKVQQVQMFGKDFVQIELTGDTFDDAYQEAMRYCKTHQKAFIHPFNDPAIIEGQGTVGLEIIEDTPDTIDYVLAPIGGGGLIAGLAAVFKTISPSTKIIGVEPAGAPAMKNSLAAGKVVTLDTIDKFVDGAAVKQVGSLTFAICQQLVDEVVTVPEGKVCSTILELYNKQAIVAEPAGAMTIAALEQLQPALAGKNVVCIVSGSNNDITRTQEIKERSLLYEGLKHYFIIRFAQRAGALREFLTDVLGPKDDIVLFEYSKKNYREKGPALVGIELEQAADFELLIERMNQKNIKYEYVNNRQDLFHYLI